MEEIRIDVRTQSPERIAEAKRSADLCYRINHTNPTTPECQELVKELFNNKIGENTIIHPPVFTILADKVKIGKNVLIASDVVITSENHSINPEANEPYSMQKLNTGSVSIEDGVWIGEKAIILPDVKIGKKSVVGAGSVVTKSIPPYCIAVGKYLCPSLRSL
jgi:acetyltransferase-like isoleucine patch superfamily enzyme